MSVAGYLDPSRLPPEYLRYDSDSESDAETEDSELRQLQEEWDENVRQLQMIVTVVLLPYAGKWFGRKLAYWAWARYVDMGFKAMFGFKK